MTTTIKVISHNAPAMVRNIDLKEDGSPGHVGEQIVRVEDGEVSFFCTTTRKLEIFDLGPDHPKFEKKSGE